MRYIYLLIVLFIGEQLNAQTVTGSWYGKAAVKMGSNSGSNYLTLLQIRQKGNEVEGVMGYYFKDQYESFYVRGSYDSRTREMIIKNIPITYFRSTTNFNIDCPMNLSVTLTSSQVGKSLKGYFYSIEEYKNTCGDLEVLFTLDPNDFSHDSSFVASFKSSKVWKSNEEALVVGPDPVAGATAKAMAVVRDHLQDSLPEKAKPLVTGNPPPEKPITVTTAPASRTIPPSVALIDTNALLIKRLAERKNTVSEEIVVHYDSIRISLYDNGDVDGDSVSIFFNGRPVVVSRMLTARAFSIYVALDTTKEVNEITMFAENLGKYPPNTALMVVTDGYRNYEVFMSSNLSQNAVLRIRRKK